MLFRPNCKGPLCAQFFIVWFYTVIGLFLAACGYGGNGVDNVQHSLPKSEEKLPGASRLVLDSNASSVPHVNESQFVELAYIYLEKNKLKHALENSRAQLILKDELFDKIHNTHLKFQQVHEGAPVWGREIIVHIDENNSVYSVSGKILPGLDGMTMKPTLTREQASDVVKQAEQWGAEGWKVETIELYVFNQNENNYLVYLLTLTKGFLREFVFVNAVDAEIMHSIPGTYTN